MAEFPRLKSGAVAQYPVKRRTAFSNSTMRFVDGSEQRIREWSGPLQKWIVELSLLDDDELAAIEEFFSQVQGRSGTFSFTDPADGTQYDGCSLEEDALEMEWTGGHRGKSRVTIRQERND